MLQRCAGIGSAAGNPEGSGRPKAVVPDGAKVIRDLEYARPDGKSRRLDLYVPEQATGRLPVIVWVHGGGWRTGSKDQAGPALRQLRRGYAVAAAARWAGRQFANASPRPSRPARRCR